VTVEADVNEALDLKSFSKPLAATYTKLLIGVSLVFGIFGLYSLFRSRKRGQKENV
jgi:hypothetical protein